MEDFLKRACLAEEKIETLTRQIEALEKERSTVGAGNGDGENKLEDHVTSAELAKKDYRILMLKRALDARDKEIDELRDQCKKAEYRIQIMKNAMDGKNAVDADK